MQFTISNQPNSEFSILNFQNKNDIKNFCIQAVKVQSQSGRNYLAAKLPGKNWKQVEQEFSHLLSTLVVNDDILDLSNLANRQFRSP